MNHPQFDPLQPLTEDLQAHLRDCPFCASLWQVDQLLRSAPSVSPPSGFMERFETRLMKERRAPQAPRPWLIALPFLLLLLSLAAGGIVPPLSLSRLFLSSLHALASTIERALLLARVTLLFFQTLYRSLPLPFWISFFTASVALSSLWLFSLRRAQLFWIQMNR